MFIEGIFDWIFLLLILDILPKTRLLSILNFDDIRYITDRSIMLIFAMGIM